jgi:hypothetical protein
MTQNQKSKMYAQIEQHGKQLNFIFNTGLEPVKLCKKLRRLEMKAHKVAVDWCNGDNGVNPETIDTFTCPILAAAKTILFSNYHELNKTNDVILFNGDARGYALKISDKFLRGNNYSIYTDWGWVWYLST